MAIKFASQKEAETYFAQYTAADFQPLGGSSRNFRNKLTGEEISRRQYDRYKGNLAKKGATSYEAARKRSTDEERLARPARGRGSMNANERTARTAGPTEGHGSRLWTDGVTAESYDKMLSALWSNKKVWAGQSGAKYVKPDGTVFRRWFRNKGGLVGNTPLDEIIDGEDAEQAVINDDSSAFADSSSESSSGQYEYFEAFIFHVRYKEEYRKNKEFNTNRYKKVQPSKRKKPGPKKKRNSLRAKRK